MMLTNVLVPVEAATYEEASPAVRSPAGSSMVVPDDTAQAGSEKRWRSSTARGRRGKGRRTVDPPHWVWFEAENREQRVDP